jgi:MGT family glycosyltransferase
MRVALLTIPATGHVNPTLDLAAELVHRRHEVTYVVPEAYRWAAHTTGANHRSYESTLVPSPQDNPPGPEFACWLPFVLLAEAQHVLPLLVPLVRELAPDVLVFDRTTYLVARVLADATGCPGVEFFPSFAYNENFSLAGESERATILNPDHEAHRKLREGFDEVAGAWGAGPVTVPDFALARAQRAVVAIPRAFQPAGETFSGAYAFTGPGLRTRGLDLHPARRRSGEVYASLGTAFVNRGTGFRAIAEAVRTTGRHGLMATGELPAEQMPPSGTAMRVERHVDQLAALARAGVFVTHAGMGSVQEALALAVPMVCLPQTTEQQAVAHRVAELGLGEVLGPDPTPADVGSALDRVSTDGRTRDLLDTWRHLVNDSDAGPRGADAVEATLRAAR